jgi:transcriptional regulator with XRE-family HTH domain
VVASSSILLGMDYGEADEILSCVMDRLQRERERKGISLQKLGAMSGVSRTAIGMIEKGQRSPTLVICLRVADALGLNLGNVLKTAIAESRRE